MAASTSATSPAAARGSSRAKYAASYSRLRSARRSHLTCILLQQFRQLAGGREVTAIGFPDRQFDFVSQPGFDLDVSRDRFFRQKRFGALGRLRELVEFCLDFSRSVLQ